MAVARQAGPAKAACGRSGQLERLRWLLIWLAHEFALNCRHASAVTAKAGASGDRRNWPIGSRSARGDAKLLRQRPSG